MRECSVDGCRGKHRARGYCLKHYSRLMRHGRVGESVGRGRAVAWVQETSAADTDECIEWPWSLNSAGYPQYRIDGRRNRLATHGVLEASGRARPAPPNDHALHSCDNPPCCNPRHLRWGSNRDNQRDAVERGQHVPVDLRGSDNPAARLTEADVLEIRALVREGVGYAAISERFGVSKSLVTLVKQRKVWGHV